MPLEQLPELDVAARSEHGNKKTFDLALAARGAAVLMPVRDARLGTDNDVQPAGPVSHAIWVKQNVPSARHGGSLPVRLTPAQGAFPAAASGSSAAPNLVGVDRLARQASRFSRRVAPRPRPRPRPRRPRPRPRPPDRPGPPGSRRPPGRVPRTDRRR